MYTYLLSIVLTLAMVRSGPHDEVDLVLRDVVIVSPGSAHHGQFADIAVDGGRIVGISDQIAAHGREEIRGNGRIVVPGLIDAHVHLYHATGLRRGLASDYQALRRDFLAQQPRSFLFYGYTTVVELNAVGSENERFEASPLHPRLIHCGQGVVLPDGFMALDVAPGDIADVFPGYLHDPAGSGFLPAGADPSAHTPDAVLDAIQAEGGQCVKLYYEEALWWPGGAPPFALPSPQILADVQQAAARRSMPVFFHATTPAGVDAGLQAGTDVFAHGMWEWPEEGFTASTPTAPTLDLVARQARSGAALQPTFRTLRNTQSLFRPELLQDPAWRDVVSDDYLAYLNTEAQQQREQFLARFSSVLPEGVTVDGMLALQENFNTRYRSLIGTYYRQGGRLSFGTDTAVGGFGWASPPGLAGYWEMLDWEAAGIPPEAILSAATIGNARILGLDQEIGSIAVGLRADILLLASDPRASIAAMSDIDVLVLEGRVIDRASLSAQSGR